MVIAKLMGGLGNQMFQYAIGRRLAHDRQTSLKFDLDFFATQTLRSYQLDSFNIQEQVALPEETAQVLGISRGPLARAAGRIFESFKPYYRRRMIVERKYFQFDPNILNAPREVCLVGYWQNENYFANIQDILRKEFTLKTPLDREGREMADMINSTLSVGIHVRRGDYVSDSHISRVHGTCDVNYYERCMRLIADQCGQPHCVVFSDDPGWARENLRLDAPVTFVGSGSPANACRDLVLMSQCKHFIIANSTFSWWTAWLSDNPDKMVYAPRNWYAVDDYDTSGLFPEGWRVV